MSFKMRGKIRYLQNPMIKTFQKNNSSNRNRYYFVDEGGDSTLFASKGKVIINTPGCSRFFILGLLDVPNPQILRQKFFDLHQQLLSDLYFKNVPSMQPNQRKTALAFHAKDDLPEVRREVFMLLRSMPDLRFFAVVADKQRVLEYVHQQNKRLPEYHYQPNELYDYLVRRLFKNILHKDSGYEITFATRGNSDRTKALRQALETARDRFNFQNKNSSVSTIKVKSAPASGETCLQAVDYFVWALQRLYEKQEERYLTFLWPSVKLVQDLDDNRHAGYGMYYTQKIPLSASVLEWRNKKTRDIG